MAVCRDQRCKCQHDMTGDGGWKSGPGYYQWWIRCRRAFIDWPNPLQPYTCVMR